MLMTIFQANAHPTKEELRQYAKSLCMSERRIENLLFYMRRKKKAEAAFPESEFIHVTHTHTQNTSM